MRKFTVLFISYLLNFCLVKSATMKAVEKRNQKAAKEGVMAKRRSRQTASIIRVVTFDDNEESAVKKAIKKEKDKARYQRKKAKEIAMKEMEKREQVREKKRKSRDRSDEAQLRR